MQRLRDNDVSSGDVKEIPREGSMLPETYDFARGVPRARFSRACRRTGEARATRSGRRARPICRSIARRTGDAGLDRREGDRQGRRAAACRRRLHQPAAESTCGSQSDPTIVYGLVGGKGTLGHGITKSELNQPTPYNTYIIDGLPPGPIANPGKAALEAVANPARTRTCIFVADGTGGHAFAETLDQHQKNVAALAPDREGRQGQARAGRDAARPDRRRSAGRSNLPSRSPFGALAAPAEQKALPATLARLGKIGAGRKAMEAAMASLAPLSSGPKSLEDIGVVVTGVNDAPAETGDFFAGAQNGADFNGGVTSAPVPAAMLADQKARAAKYGAPEGEPMRSPARSIRRCLPSRPRAAGRASATPPKAPSSIRYSTRPGI